MTFVIVKVFWHKSPNSMKIMQIEYKSKLFFINILRYPQKLYA